MGGVRVMPVTRRIEMLLNGFVPATSSLRVVHPIAILVAGGIERLDRGSAAGRSADGGVARIHRLHRDDAGFVPGVTAKESVVEVVK